MFVDMQENIPIGKLLISITVLFVIACNNSPTKSDKENDDLMEEFKSVKILNTVNENLKTCNIAEISTAYYLPLFIGKQPKSIDLSNFIFGVDSFCDYNILESGFEIEDLTLFVDTSRRIGSIINRQFPKPPPPSNLLGDNLISDESIIFNLYESYLVFLKNSSDTSSILIGFENLINLIIEAKDSLGNWKPIQKPYFRKCFTGVRGLYLPPQNVLITTCPIFSGEYKTQIRLTFGGVFLDENDEEIKPFVSNEFEGFINYSQFEHLDSTLMRRNIYCD
jgi:hypothetical protein